MNHFFEKHKKGLINILIILLFISLFLQSAYVAVDKSITTDEYSHATLGYYYVKNHAFNIDGAIANSVLSHYLISVFLLPLEFDLEVLEKSDNGIGYGMLYDSDYSAEFVIFLARLPVILLSLLLGFYVFRWSKNLYGIKAGLFSLFLYSFSPNIIAHSSLATTDLATAFFIFISLYSFDKYIRNKTRLNLGFLAVSFSLAFITKFTSFFLFPIFFIMLMAQRGNFWKMIREVLSLFLILLLTTFLVLLVAYQFTFAPLIEGMPVVHREAAYDYILEHFDSEQQKAVLGFVEGVPIPAPTFVYGLVDNFVHSVNGHASFLFGMFSNKGWRYYYPLGFFVKTPVPTILFFIAALYFMKKADKRVKDKFFILLSIVVFFCLFAFNKTNTGIRHMLFIYPLVFVFVSGLVSLNVKRKKLLNLGLLALCLWYFISAAVIFPDNFAYFNELVGGPGEGYKYLTDANLDWGQDLKSLKKYLDEHNIGKIKLNYFGGYEAVEYYGINYELLPPEHNPAYMFLNESEIEKMNMECGPSDGMIAISATNLQNTYIPNKTCFDWLKKYEPIEKIGYSIFLYNISKDE